MKEPTDREIEQFYERLNARITELQNGVRTRVEIERHSDVHISGRMVREPVREVPLPAAR